MIAGINSYNGSFLADLSNLEAQIANVNKQITSGFRVNQASDDPAAVAPIISYQVELSQLKQVQTNLNTTQTEAQTADGALQTAASLMDQLVSLGSKGASSTSTAADRQTIGLQVQQIEQQLVSVANTSVGGRYIFGGDATASQPYTYNWGATSGVTANIVPTPTNTATVRDGDGNEIVPRMTAQAIFDVPNPVQPLPPAPQIPTSNIFQGAFNLGSALLSNNQAAAAAALDDVKAGVTQLGSATTFYGNTQNWIQQASSSATDKVSSITQSLSAIRDSDVATDATQLTLDRTALEAALSAHASLSTKSLFSYLG